MDGGVVVRDAAGEPTGVLYEESAWRFKARYVETPEDEYLAAMRDGVKVAASRGVTCLHDKDGWLGAIGLWQRLEAQGGLPLRVWQSTPAEHAARTCASSACAAAPALPFSGSATSRRSWTGRSARRPRG